MIIALLIFSIFAPLAQAQTADQMVLNYSTATALERVESSYIFCEQAMAQWPAPDYQTKILRLGQLWSEAPEAAYATLSLCQSMWQKTYLDPSRVTTIRTNQDRAKLAIYLAMADVVNVYQYLREEIRLHNTTIPAVNPAVPPAPFEILSGMASSERQMDTLLLVRVRETGKTFAAGLTGIGGTGVTLLKGAKAVTNFTTFTSRTVGTLVKQALLITALSMAAGEVADLGLWRLQHGQLSGQVTRLLQQLNSAPPQAPIALYLDQLYSAVEQLGYFYSIDLYLRDSGATTPSQIISKKCLPVVNGAVYENQSLVAPLLSGGLCRDATALWIATAQYVAQKFQGQPAAQAMSARLMAKAKRSVLSQADIDAYWAAQPVCHEVVHPLFLFFPVYECVDKTGSVII